jgi:DNA-directed RNA polymerase specialized sigma24 family protein
VRLLPQGILSFRLCVEMKILDVQPDDQLVREVLAGRRNAYGDLVRRYERQVHAVAWSITVPEIPMFDAPADEDAVSILAALACLPDHEQQVVLLYYFDGFAVADIATLLRCPVGTVTKQLSRALSRMRDRLKEKL